MLFSRSCLFSTLCGVLICIPNALAAQIRSFSIPSTQTGAVVADGLTSFNATVSLSDANLQAPVGAQVTLIPEPGSGVTITPSSYIVASASSVDTPITVRSSSVGTKKITATVNWENNTYSVSRNVDFIVPINYYEMWNYSGDPSIADGATAHRLLVCLVTEDYDVPYGAKVTISTDPADQVVVKPSQIDNYQADTELYVTTTKPGSPIITMTVDWGGKTYTAFTQMPSFTSVPFATCIVTTDHPVIMADNISRIMATATVRYNNGQPVPGVSVTFDSSLIGVTSTLWSGTTDSSGKVVAYLKKGSHGTGTLGATAFVPRSDHVLITVPALVRAPIGFATGTPSVFEYIDDDFRNPWYEHGSGSIVSHYENLNGDPIHGITYVKTEAWEIAPDSGMHTTNFHIIRDVTWYYDAGSPTDQPIAGWYMKSHCRAKVGVSGTISDGTGLFGGWANATVYGPFNNESNWPCNAALISGVSATTTSDDWFDFSSLEMAVPYDSTVVGYICSINCESNASPTSQNTYVSVIAGGDVELTGVDVSYTPVNPQ